MALDAFNISKTVEKLNETLTGGKINKVNQPNKEEITLSVYCREKTLKLVISAHAKYARIALTNLDKTNPLVAPNFCMLLRKHLSGGEIKGIKQLGWERIVEITIENKNELFEKSEKKLYVEIMGKYSNVILCENSTILGTLKNTTLEVNSVRPLFTGLTYTLPKKQDKINPFDKEKSLEILEKYNGENLGDYLFKNFSGLSVTTSQEIAHRFSKIISVENFYESFADFLRNCDINPCIITSQNFTDFSCCDLTCFCEQEKTFYEDLLICQKEFFDKSESEKDFSLKKNSLLAKISSHLKKAEKKQNAVFETLEYSEKFEQNRVKGELILANVYQIKKGDKQVILLNYYDQTQIKIDLDEKLSPAQNAEKYFKKYNKQKTAIKYAQKNLCEIQDEIKYLNSVKAEIIACENVSSLKDVESEMQIQKLIPQKEKPKKSEPFKYFSYQGFLIRMGKNNVSNDLLREESKGKDLWFHAKNYHSPFVVAKYEGKEFTDNLKYFCASLCAYYSENRLSDKTEIDYTLIKYVKKPPSSRPGSVIYSANETIIAKPLSQKEFEINP